MDNIVRLQISAFVSTHIEPNDPNDLQFLIDEFQKLGSYTLLQTPVLSQTLDILTKQTKNTQQLGFSTTDQTCQIICLDNRIDITLTNTKEQKPSVDFAQKALQIIMKQYSIRSNRFALNIDKIYPSIRGDCRQKELKSFFPEYFKDKTLIDSVANVAIRETITINEKSEELNIITTLNNFQAMDTKEKIVGCHLDISTLPENDTYRLKEGSLKEFSDRAFSLADKIIKSIAER